MKDNLNFNFQHNFETKGHKIEATAFYSDQDQLSANEESDFFSDAEFVPTEEYLQRVRSTELEEESDVERV